MNKVMTCKYTLITIAFIPLFFLTTIRLKQVIGPAAFSQIRWKTIGLFLFYSLITDVRLYAYFYLIRGGSNNPQLNPNNEDLLYVTEILLTLLIIYMLLSNNS